MIQNFKDSGPHALVKSKSLSNLLGKNFTDGPGIALFSHQLKHFLSVLFILFFVENIRFILVFIVCLSRFGPMFSTGLCAYWGQVPCHLSLYIPHSRVFFFKKLFCHSTWHTGSLLPNQGSDLCSPQQKHGDHQTAREVQTKCLELCRDKVNVWWWWSCLVFAGHYSGFVRALPALFKKWKLFSNLYFGTFSQYFPFPKIDLAFSIQLDRLNLFFAFALILLEEHIYKENIFDRRHMWGTAETEAMSLELKWHPREEQ